MGTLSAQLFDAGLLVRAVLERTTENQLAGILATAAKAAAVNCECSGGNPPTLAEVQRP